MTEHCRYCASTDRAHHEDDHRRDPSYEVGDIVKAFHPRTVGVVKHGEIKYVGKRWYSIDFGPLLGGRYTVDASHVLGLAGTPEDTEE